MKPAISWKPSLSTAKHLKNSSIILATLCLVAVPFCRGSVDDDFPIFVLPLFLLNFPLFFGAVLILVSRTEGKRTKDWTKVLFRGLPDGFARTYKLAFFTIWLIGMYLMVGPMLAGDKLPSLGISPAALFALVPAVFYLTSYGAYASVVVERINEAQQGGAGNVG
ncbi:hypothetical protein [Pelagicoccus mobilis]|uniref:Uncharacterized protein n=1 Tax=Pelagicoccus mobilis TaxID=415221 RepID=A0A934VSR7_9BACT|nr:hypothetical protein [Pelagicoccus mobilis]MBK1880702.1 hypothetical protein [Pelagicoccus mobilis]